MRGGGNNFPFGFSSVYVLSNEVTDTENYVTVFPIVSCSENDGIPSHVAIRNFNNYGMSVPSSILVDKIMPVPVSFLEEKLGEVKDEEMIGEIRNAMKWLFPIMN